MKRLWIFVLCGVAAMVVGSAFGGPAERFVKYASNTLDAGDSTQLFIPTYNGVGFRPTKIAYYVTSVGGDALLDVTVYLPPSMGPSAATDSFVVRFFSRGSSDDFKWGEYYGPMSDTMRVETNTGARGHLNAYGG